MKILVSVLLMVMMNNICAQEVNNDKDSISVISMPQIQVVLERDRLLSKVSGSVSVIESKSIRKISPTTGNELLRKIPGLNVVDEEGAGLRMNIGVRGLDPDRSRNILILEDGIPVALNPYGEPEMYFTPPIDKMTTIEVLKGSGQILFGPQTTGGVINFITSHPPEKKQLHLKSKLDQVGFFQQIGVMEIP